MRYANKSQSDMTLYSLLEWKKLFFHDVNSGERIFNWLLYFFFASLCLCVLM